VFLKLMITVFMTLCLSACAVFAPVVEDSGVAEQLAAEPGTLPEGEGWWYARFHIDWPEGEEARWYMGTLIGGEVIAPVFDDYYQDVYIWRVHRRASRDGHGHVFSFIFYSTPQGAQRIYNGIESNMVVQSMLENGQLIKVEVDDVTRITRPDIQDTSDDHWPESIQKTWPAMIMGVSRMWLDLVSELAAEEHAFGGLEAKYKNVQESVTGIWRVQGQHVMLHHLNAVYAYQPLLIRY